jgi:hypothetical protein
MIPLRARDLSDTADSQYRTWMKKNLEFNCFLFLATDSCFAEAMQDGGYEGQVAGMLITHAGLNSLDS